MKDLAYCNMNYKELMDTIKSCRHELLNRGTVTRFCRIHFKTKKILKEYEVRE